MFTPFEQKLLLRVLERDMKGYTTIEAPEAWGVMSASHKWQVLERLVNKITHNETELPTVNYDK